MSCIQYYLFVVCFECSTTVGFKDATQINLICFALNFIDIMLTLGVGVAEHHPQLVICVLPIVGFPKDAFLVLVYCLLYMLPLDSISKF